MHYNRLSMLRLAVFALALAPLLVQAQKQPYSLDAMTDLQSGVARSGAAAPMPAAWGPDGRSFLIRRDGTLAIYDPAARRARDLVSASELEGAAVRAEALEQPYGWENRRVRAAGPQFSSSGAEILYPAGGDLFLIQVATGKWQQLTKTAQEEEDAKLSPDGKMAAFRRDWDLYVLEISTGKETRLTSDGSDTLRNGGLDWVYPEELELGTAYWWSPDSKSIAFLQFDTSREPLVPHADLLGERARYEPQRYPQAGENNAMVRMGIVGPAGGAIRWVDAGDTRNLYLIARAGWMPGSRAVYVLRMNRVQNALEMISFDAATGDSRQIFRETDPYWINLADDILFLKDGQRFLRTSERDGYRHIYSYSIDGKNVKQLTRGDWEVTAINAVDEERGRIFYTSNEGGRIGRRLYSIKLDGSDKRLLTPEAGTHAVAMGPSGAFHLDTYSTMKTPPRTLLRAWDGAELGVYREADRALWDEYELQPVEVVPFKGADGTELSGRLIRPAGFQSGKKYPVIVLVYGGPGVDLPVKDAWAAAGMDQVYANAGYVVWQAENRGGQGRGHAFETSIFRQLGKVELADQVAGVKHLISMGFADAARVGITGSSYGGFMTLNAMLEAQDVFRCGVAGAPVTNWLNYDSIYTERYMGLPADNAKGYRDTALPPKAAYLKRDLMIVHNYEDDNVLFQNTMQMIDALQQAGKVFGMMLYPQKTHAVTGPAGKQMNASALEFFGRCLK